MKILEIKNSAFGYIPTELSPNFLGWSFAILRSISLSWLLKLRVGGTSKFFKLKEKWNNSSIVKEIIDEEIIKPIEEQTVKTIPKKKKNETIF